MLHIFIYICAKQKYEKYHDYRERPYSSRGAGHPGVRMVCGFI